MLVDDIVYAGSGRDPPGVRRVRADYTCVTWRTAIAAWRVDELPEAGDRLGVNRTAVNAMILDGRLMGERLGRYWRARRDLFEELASSYRPPPNVPFRSRDPDALAPVAERALGWLARWEAASTTELREVMSDAPATSAKRPTSFDDAACRAGCCGHLATHRRGCRTRSSTRPSRPKRCLTDPQRARPGHQPGRREAPL